MAEWENFANRAFSSSCQPTSCRQSSIVLPIAAVVREFSDHAPGNRARGRESEEWGLAQRPCQTDVLGPALSRTKGSEDASVQPPPRTPQNIREVLRQLPRVIPWVKSLPPDQVVDPKMFQQRLSHEKVFLIVKFHLLWRKLSDIFCVEIA